MSPKTESKRESMKDKLYRPILGSVMWGQLATWPDLSFLISLLAWFQSNPGINHWNALMHVIGYIKNTLDYGLTYSHDFELTPSAFVDADYGGCKDTWRLTSGYVFTMAGGVVTWSSKRQATVALSTIEVEYVAMSWCAQQMAWMQSWLDEVKIECSQPGIIKGIVKGWLNWQRTLKIMGKLSILTFDTTIFKNSYNLELFKLIKFHLQTTLQIYSLNHLLRSSPPTISLSQYSLSPSPSMGECWNIPGVGNKVANF